MNTTELSITQVVTSNLSKAMESMLEETNLGYESELKKLQGSVSNINKVLENALRNEECLTVENRRCIEKIKEAIYEADDVVDELFAVNHLKKNAKSTSRVRSLFSNTSGMIKGVRKQCQGIVDMNVSIHSSDRITKREDTYSYLHAPNVIGRDGDVKTVLDMLICPDGRVVSIVGMGGLGKTTVAQLVFNHKRAVDTFTKRVWVCVGECVKLEDICTKILETGSVSEKSLNADGDSCMRKLGQLLQETNLLLVLDDVWHENANDLQDLRRLFENEGEGSRILVTTRFRSVDKIIGKSLVHDLKGLSEDHSRKLFESTAFDVGQERDSQLVEIGRNIVAQCANVPLALKVTGSLLYGQHRHKWLACQESIRDNTLYDSSSLISSLKLSYYNLETHLKCCFTFCALFPKGFKIQKDLLLSLWMAQGYILKTSYSDESIDDVAEKYFKVLLERGFLQDVEMNEYGDIVSCRIHDLMHVLAQQLAGEGLGVVKISANISEKAHHVFHDAKHNKEVSFGKTKIRTYIQSGFQGQFPVATLVANCKSLRALGLYDLADGTLVDSIGKLNHLRHLDLSRNKDLQTLPKSLLDLCYLETLVLRGCSKLNDLPSDLKKLTFLRCLDILGCESLTRMPLNMSSLSRLRTLTLFVMDEEKSSGKLTELKELKDLKGCIEILIPAKYTADGKYQGECLRAMDNFNAVSLHFQKSVTMECMDRDSTLLEMLQPHENLQGLTLKGYRGSLVHWAASIVNLVKLELISCEGLKHLSFLSKLVLLKTLKLQNLLYLEYIEDARNISASCLHEPEFFPSLEYLDISEMSRLEKWWGKVDLLEGGLADSFKRRQLAFPCLSRLHIESCPKLSSFPPCPKVDKLYLTELIPTLPLFDWCPEGHLSATEMEIDDIRYIKSLATNNEKVYTYTNLQKLKIGGRSLPSSHTTTEESRDGNIKGGNEEDKPWKLLHKSLQTLELDSLEKMVNLPEGMQHLTALRHLNIKHCNNLKVIPEWISCLVSLESLSIISCTGLKLLPESMRKLISLRHLEIQGHTYLQKRCQPIHGEDWPKIQHIRSISVQQSL